VDGRRRLRLRADQSEHLLPRRAHAGKGAGLRSVKFYEDRFVNLWRFADDQLAKTQYLAGDEITAADLAVYPIYAGRKALPDNAGLKHLQAWGERIGSRPGVQKGMKLEN
jgi:glutathione S-transferase